MSLINGRIVTASAEDAQTILERAKGRKLRQDEKVKLHGPPILLAHPWTPDVDPTGWWMSEKLDGVRAYWNGKDFVSRQGNIYNAPEWFKEGLPHVALDGELWMGRQKFQETLSIVRKQNPNEQEAERWKNISYQIFDMPTGAGTFEDRYNGILRFYDMLGSPTPYATYVEQTKCNGIEHLRAYLAELEALGAEGVMLRQPGSLYEAKRSHTCLKVKSFHDSEATVIAHAMGKGRNANRMGAITVRLDNGKEFDIGTGFTDSERESPPAIGARVTFRYTETTRDGLPKCASYVATRDYE